LNKLGREELETVGVTILKSPGIGIFITEALARMIGLEQFEIMESKHLLEKFATDTRKLWNRDGVRQAVRASLDKVTKCRTPLLGAEIYASDKEVKTVCHICKSRFCPGCGHQATLSWQREQWCALPDVRYSEICFTMPNVLWPLLHRDRELLHDIAARPHRNPAIALLLVLGIFTIRRSFNRCAHHQKTASDGQHAV